ncbi:hypothetical protein C8J56DRAFT_1116499 [Mycena floridula]|nr:hypothetical protein C8J56DRAFT_1116499 [Mycena floridula]
MTLTVEVKTFIDLSNPSNEDLEALSQACQPATFGRGTADIMDEFYRKAGKLDSSRFASLFDLHESGIMDRVASLMVEDSKGIKAELYKLNMYGKGSFFKAHKDTPRGNDMIGSLVVVSRNTTSTLKERVAIEGPSIGYIAFYSDIEHEVTPVTSGHRITLTYNLYVEKPLSPLLEKSTTETDISSIYLPLKAADSSFLPEGGRLGWGLQYSYLHLHGPDRGSFDLQSILNALKGADSTLYRVCQALKLPATLYLLYDCYDDSQVLASSFPDLDNTDMEEPVAVRLVDRFGGLLIAKGEDFESSRRKFEEVKVTWVTTCTEFNRVETSYIAYGNQASSEFLYGDLCLIVDMPDFAHRVWIAA